MASRLTHNLSTSPWLSVLTIAWPATPPPSNLPSGRSLRSIEKHPDFFPMYTVRGKWHHAGRSLDPLDRRVSGRHDVAVSPARVARRLRPSVRRRCDPARIAWRTKAEHYSKLLEHRQHDRNVHDLGFIFLNTYLPWYELTGEPRLHDVLIQAGRTLAMRFMEKGQYLRSFVAPESLFIDIMMNVPIIFYAAHRDGRPRAGPRRHAALPHDARHDRPARRLDGPRRDLRSGDAASSCGRRRIKGSRGDSAWARGLAWSLYGYSKCYALTGNREFLDVAERNADYWIDHLPADKVPLLGFRRRSVAAAAVGPAEGIERRRPSPPAACWTWRGRPRSPARERVSSRPPWRCSMPWCEPEYLASDTPGWEGILKHGVYHTAKNLGVDESVMWGEFFFVEALTKVVTNGFDRVSPETLAKNQKRYRSLT